MKFPEDPDRDFPFYQGNPVSLTAAHWCFLIAVVAMAFALLIAPIPWPGGEPGAIVPAILFPLIPLVALSWIATASELSTGGLVLFLGKRRAIGGRGSADHHSHVGSPALADRACRSESHQCSPYGLARFGSHVRTAAPVDIQLGFCAVSAHHRHRAPGSLTGLHQNEKPVSQLRRSHSQRLAPDPGECARIQCLPDLIALSPWLDGGFD